MTELDYAENDRGIHVMVTAGAEFSLCGDAWDTEEAVYGQMAYGARQVVTCPDCIAIIKALRRVKYSEAA